MKQSSRWRSLPARALTAAFLFATAAAPAGAHNQAAPAVPADRRPEIFNNVGVEPKLGALLSPDVSFRDESGGRVTMRNYFSDRPLLLVFSYFNCPMLCPLVLDGVVRAVKPLSLEPGRDFDVIVLSIDERDTPEAARTKKAEYVGRYGRSSSAAGWHFLTGDRRAIESMTREAGFNYAFDEASNQFVHAAAIFVLTAEGKIARVLYGVDYAPKDVRLALVEAGNGRIGSIIDQIQLYCYHYDPAAGKYGLVIMNSLRLAGSATVLALVTFISLMLWRDRRAAGAEAKS